MSRHGKHGKRRPGVHKHRDSPETHRWNREELVPRQPTWMDGTTYAALARLRSDLEARA